MPRTVFNPLRRLPTPMRNHLATLALLAAALPAWAGSLDAPAAPASGSGMPSTTDIYNRLDTGATVSVPGTFQEPAAGPTAGTGRTLADIAAKLPVPDNTQGAAAGDVANGKTFWGLRTDGTWGPRTGTQAAPATGSNVTGANGQLTFTIPDGLYSGGKTATATDSNLQPGNIKSGVTLFGVSGSPTVVDTAETTAPVTAADISAGKKAYVNGTLVTGTSALVTSHVASAQCAQGWGGANCDVCGNGWTGSNCDACPTGWTGSNCEVVVLPIAGNPQPLHPPWKCIHDPSTGLTWEGKVDSSPTNLHYQMAGHLWYISTDPDPGTPDNRSCSKAANTLVFERCDTEKFITVVNAEELCGYTDWRLPSESELVLYFQHHPISITRAWTNETTQPGYAKYVDSFSRVGIPRLKSDYGVGVILVRP